ncbi:hypothetical protein [Streptomyces kronopolitis]|uniref:hypothetical protein n=1 Tax=Streptomyces kronopolitis TaxID=1612435 RepID=UPI0020BEEBA0|nr:hypothetical protein [Streptomyces kronopolitis]MCL6301291.1 hypothetical protein [Streptomyces kronopolitis]
MKSLGVPARQAFATWQRELSPQTERPACGDGCLDTRGNFGLMCSAFMAGADRSCDGV